MLLGASWEIYFGGPRINLMIERGGNPEHEKYVNAISELFRDGDAALFDKLGELGVGVDVIAPVAEVPRSAPLCEAQLAHFYSCDIAAAESEAVDKVARTWLQEQMKKLAGNPAVHRRQRRVLRRRGLPGARRRPAHLLRQQPPERELLQHAR